MCKEDQQAKQKYLQFDHDLAFVVAADGAVKRSPVGLVFHFFHLTHAVVESDAVEGQEGLLRRREDVVHEGNKAALLFAAVGLFFLVLVHQAVRQHRRRRQEFGPARIRRLLSDDVPRLRVEDDNVALFGSRVKNECE